MYRCLFLLGFIFSSAIGFAQTLDQKLVQFSGIIVNIDSNTVVPYVTITNRSAHNQSFSANYKGYFSFVAHKGDTLVFSGVGYGRTAIIIPPNLADNRYTVVIKMRQEVINLPLVQVYPWASPDEFKKEFLTMKFADDDLEIAKKNVSRENILAMAATLPRDGKEIQSLNFQNNHNALTSNTFNQRMANPLLNPFAWGALIQQIMQGDQSRTKE